jgi:hypothetical protein
MWIIVLTDLDTGETEEYYHGDLSWKKRLKPEGKKPKKIAGHNIIGFDLKMLLKLFNFELDPSTLIVDTLILSQVLDFNRFNGRHSLEAWGEFLGIPKVEHEDWSALTEEMKIRCRGDVTLNKEVYGVLKEELKEHISKNKKIIDYLDVEHAVAEWCALAEFYGWPFNEKEAEKLREQLKQDLNVAYKALSAKLGTKTVAVDKVKGIVEEKRPKWTKHGFYDVHTSRWFNIDPCSGYEGEERLVQGPYCRVEFVPLSLDSVADVKVFLYRNGWEPTEWNYKFEDGKRIKTSPKITEDSLEFLGGDGKLYVDFLTAKSRLGILETWIKECRNGSLHGSCFPIGTPSMRARHKIIVNVPSTDSAWGKEMRALFGAEEGWVLIGCDSSGNQARGLAHYLNNEAFTDTLLNGDIHTFNAEMIDKVLDEVLGIVWSDYLLQHGIALEEIPKRKRSVAKRILYAFLFGASGGKLWSYIFNTVNDNKGKKFKNGFTEAVPGFEKLIKDLEGAFSKNKLRTGKGFIRGIAGQKLYVDSYHKLLVYLLQALEKATCAAAVMYLMKDLKARNIPFRPSIFMHDEVQFRVPKEYAEEAALLGKSAFKEGPKLFGVMIMDGDARIGNNWFDTH